MLIAPLAWNHLDGATLITSASGFQRGFPGANAWDQDVRRPAICRGRMKVTAGVNDKIDFDDGAVRAGTIAAGTYNSVVEWCIAAAAAMNAVSTVCYVTIVQGSTNRYRIKVGRTAGTLSLLNSTGANAATSALVVSGGYGPYDRTAAASHVGDCAVTHYPSDQIEADLGSLLIAEVDFVALPGLSQGGTVSVSTGSTTPVDSASDLATTYSGEAFDSEVMLLRPTQVAHRYAALNLIDPRREDCARASVGYWYHGLAFDTDRSTVTDRLTWEYGTWGRGLDVGATFDRSTAGHVHVTEAEVGETFTVAFQGSPGLGPEMVPGIRALLAGLGSSGLAFVALDPTGSPHGESRLCRLVSPPDLAHAAVQSVSGRWGCSMTFATVRGMR